MGLLKEYAINLGGFISLLGGISLLEKGPWFVVGIALFLLGLATMAYAFYTMFLEKKFEMFSAAFVIKMNALGVAVLMAVQLILYLKDGFNWPLHLLLLLILLFLMYSLKYAPAKKQ